MWTIQRAILPMKLRSTGIHRLPTCSVTENNGTPIDPIEPVAGDVNADGAFNVADVATLQKWLLAVPDVELADWKTGDLYQDDVLNVIDLCFMKQKLING